MENDNETFARITITLEKGTDIGFNKEEIKKTNTEDLLTLRKSTVLYLKSKKLKKRNANFLEVYQRINDELKERKMLLAKEKQNLKEGFVKVRKTSSTEGLSTTSLEEFGEKTTLLKRKCSLSLEIVIPSFLNDKKQKIEKTKPQEECEKPAMKNCLSDFGKGLFGEKFDFDASDDLDSYKLIKKSTFDVELKEIEIKSAMFNSVQEDNFFSLD